MRRLLLPGLSAVLCLLGVAPGAAQDGRGGDDPWRGTSPHCAWMVLDAMVLVGETCFPGQDADLRAAAREGVRDLEALLIAHSKSRPSAATMQEQRLRLRREYEANGALCRGDIPQLYTALRDAGPQSIRRGVKGMVDRPEKVDDGACF